MLHLPCKEEVVALSAQMVPLRSADATAVLASAMNQFPEGTPARALHITAALQAAAASTRQFCARQIGDLIDRLSTAPAAVGWLRLVQSCFPSGVGSSVVLIPAVKQCVACSRAGVCMPLPDGVRKSTPTVYSERGKLTGRLFIKICSSCGARHHISYAEGGSRLPTHQSPGAHEPLASMQLEEDLQARMSEPSHKRAREE